MEPIRLSGPASGTDREPLVPGTCLSFGGIDHGRTRSVFQAAACWRLTARFMKTGIGLDFGTTNSSIAIAGEDRSSKAVLFQSSSGAIETYRSVLYFEPKTPASTGPAAIERYLAAEEKGRLIQ